MFETDQDRTNAHEVAKMLGERWRCEIEEFGELSTIDWFAKRDRRLIALLELKCRHNRSSDAYPTTMLSLRKYTALTFGSLAFGCPSFFVVRFTDGIFFADVRALDPTANCVAGRKDRTELTRFDVEPVIEFPVGTMRRLNGGEPR